jgi:hypothetical protein
VVTNILVELIASIYPEDEGDKFLQKLVTTYKTAQRHNPADYNPNF